MLSASVSSLRSPEATVLGSQSCTRRPPAEAGQAPGAPRKGSSSGPLAQSLQAHMHTRTHACMHSHTCARMHLSPWHSMEKKRVRKQAGRQNLERFESLPAGLKNAPLPPQEPPPPRQPLARPPALLDVPLWAWLPRPFGDTNTVLFLPKSGRPRVCEQRKEE